MASTRGLWKVLYVVASQQASTSGFLLTARVSYNIITENRASCWNFVLGFSQECYVYKPEDRHTEDVHGQKGIKL